MLQCDYPANNANKVVAMYLEATNAMEATKIVHFEALANERLAFYLVKHHRIEDAEAYFERALELYRFEWGSLAKYEWLRERRNKYLSSREEFHDQHVGEDIVIQVP